MKHGQIALFVIIGLALLLIAGVIVMMHRTNVPPSLQAAQDTATVTSRIESCLAAKSEEALRRIGASGGYADITRLRSSPDVASTQVVALGPQRVPLWHEIHPCAESTAGCLGNHQPPLCRQGERGCPRFTGIDEGAMSVQESLETAIAAAMPSCLGSIGRDDLTIESIEEPSAHATIREDSVAVALAWPLRVTASDNTRIDLKEFRATLPVRLPETYRLASSIHQSEAQTGFIELAFLDLLAIYSGVDTPIPPFRDVSLVGQQQHFWIRSQVKELIEQDLLPYMDLLQVVNAERSYTPILPSNETPEQYRPYIAGLYEYLAIKLDDRPYDLSASFVYPETGMDLDINGKEFLKPTKFEGGGFLADFAGLLLTQYKFRYDAAFPVIVNIDDADAFNGRGFRLTFGLEANVRNNNPLNASADIREISGGTPTIDPTNPWNLVDHMYRVAIKDRHTGAPLPDAVVSYACGGTRQLGVTGTDGMWTGKLPYCFAGGGIRVERFGYLSAGQDLASTEDDGATSDIELGLWRENTKRVIVFKRSPSDIDNITLAGSTPASLAQQRTTLGINDTVIATISRQKIDAYESDEPLQPAVQLGTRTGAEGGAYASRTPVEQLLKQAKQMRDDGHLSEAEYQQLVALAQDLKPDIDRPGGNAGDYVLEENLSLVPGTYDIDATLLFRGLLQIPIDHRCKSIDPLGVHQECFDLPAQNFTTWVPGGATLTGADGVILPEEFVYSDRPLVLFVLEQPLPMSWKDVERQQDIGAYQTYDRRLMVQPET